MQPEGISNATEKIPVDGSVTKDHWGSYWAAFVATAGEDGGIGRASATRFIVREIALAHQGEVTATSDNGRIQFKMVFTKTARI